MSRNESEIRIPIILTLKRFYLMLNKPLETLQDSTFRKGRLALFGFSAMTIVVILALAVFVYRFQIQKPYAQFCPQQVCGKLLEYLRWERRSDHTDPCTDFYDFVCQSWMNKSEPFTTLVQEAEVTLTKKLLRQLQTTFIYEFQVKTFRNMAEYYSACRPEILTMDTFGVTWRHFMEEAGYPFSRIKKIETPWQMFFYFFSFSVKFGISTLTVVRIEYALNKTMVIFNPFTSIVQNYYPRAISIDLNNQTILLTVRQRMESILNSMGMKVNDTFLDTFIDVDIKISKLFIEFKKFERNQNDDLYLKQIFEANLFGQRAETIAAQLNSLLPGSLQLTKNDYIKITGKSRIEKAIDLIINMNESNIRSYYLLLQSVTRVEKLYRVKQTGDAETADVLNKYSCYSLLNKYFTDPWNTFYALKQSVEKRIAMTHIYMAIKRQAVRMVKQNRFMDPGTREKAYRRVISMRLKLFQADLSHIERTYGLLSPFGKNFYENHAKIRQLYLLQTYLKSFKGKNLTKSHVENNVRVSYILPGNQIMSSMAVAEQPFFILGQVRLINHATVGTLMGAEMFTGFISNNRFLDDFGNEFAWWSPNSDIIFNAVFGCYLENLRKDGSILKESSKRRDQLFSWVSAITAAYYTDRPNHFHRKPVKPIPWHHRVWYHKKSTLTYDQIFFIRYCSLFCEKAVEKSVPNKLSGKEKCNWVLTNFEDFHHAFSCPNGTRMRGENICNLWT